MKIVSLFNTDMEYKKFISEIKNNRKLTSHEELKPYRKNINIFLLYLNYNVTNEELDKIVNFVQNLGDVSLHYNVLEAIRIAFDNKVDSLIKGLTILYRPDLFEGDFSEFLFQNWKLFINATYNWGRDVIDTGDSYLDEIYKCINNIMSSEELAHYYPITNHTVIIIIAAAHYNHIFSEEYIMNILNDLDYYNYKLEFSGCSIHDEKKLNFERAEYVFNHFTEIFTKEQVEIR